MANTINTAQLIARQTAAMLETKLGVAALVHRDYAREFGPGKTGTTVNIRAPLYYQSGEGAAATSQPIQDRDIPLTINRRRHIMVDFTQEDMTLKESALAERFSMPAAVKLATDVEQAVLAETLLSSWDTSAAWTTAAPALFDYLEARKMAERLTEAGAAPEDRILALTSPMVTAATNDLTRLGNVSSSTEAYRTGELPRIAGARTFETNLLPVQANGARALSGITITSPAAVTYETATANNYRQTVTFAQTATNVSGWIRKGEVVTFAGCFAVNPIAKDSAYPHLRQFTVQEDANLDTNAISVVVSPPMITTGAYRTVSALPNNGAAVVVVSSGNASLNSTPGCMMHKDAIALATIPLVRPLDAGYWGSASYKGITVNVMGGSSIENCESKLRFDVLFGLKVINPDMMVRSRGRVS